MTAGFHDGLVTLRQVADADLPFLLRLYSTTRAQELSLTPWSEPQKAAFVRMQFDAQDRAYHERFPGATFDVIELDGDAIGRLYVDWGPGDVRIIEIALVPEHRGRGIGGTLLERILVEARATNRSASVHVEHDNPARHLYERLGFVEVEKGEMRSLMRAPGTRDGAIRSVVG